MEIEKINGREILKFLENELDNNDNLYDVSVNGPLEFEFQQIRGGKYILGFTAYFNNWGTHQPIEGNSVSISKGGVRFNLEEPFEGDGSDDALDEVLNEWLQTHEFDANSEEVWMDILRDAYEELPQIGFNDPDGLQGVIDKLEEAKTYMHD